MLHYLSLNVENQRLRACIGSNFVADAVRAPAELKKNKILSICLADKPKPYGRAVLLRGQATATDPFQQHADDVTAMTSRRPVM